MIVYAIASNGGLPSAAEVRSHVDWLCRREVREVELDVRSAAGAEPATIADLATTLMAMVGVGRIHCTLQQFRPPLRRLPRVLADVHVNSADVARWQPPADCPPFALTLHVGPGARVPSPRLRLRGFRLAFVTLAESGATSWHNYADAACGALAWIETLVADSTPVAILDPLPFCLFSDAQQGMLARECLVNGDYRTGELTLAFRSDATIAPWHGALSSVLFDAGSERPLRTIMNFYRAASLWRTNSLATRDCESCTLRRNGSCHAAEFYAAPPHTRPAVYRVPDVVTALADFRLATNPDARMQPAADGATLFIDGARTLDVLRLNRSATAIWELATRSSSVAGLVQAIVEQEDTSYALPVLQIVDTLQEHGFLRLHRDGRHHRSMKRG